MLFSALNNLTRSLTNTKNLKFQVARFFKASNELFILFYFFYCFRLLLFVQFVAGDRHYACVFLVDDTYSFFLQRPLFL